MAMNNVFRNMMDVLMDIIVQMMMKPEVHSQFGGMSIWDDI